MIKNTIEELLVFQKFKINFIPPFCCARHKKFSLEKNCENRKYTAVAFS